MIGYYPLWDAKSCDPMIDEMIDYGFRGDSPQWKRFWPACVPVDDGEDIVETIGVWKRAHDVHVDCVE